MIEEDTNWFAKWEEQLPSPDELMPISQSLITPDLALAFDIKPPYPSPSQNHPLGHLRRDIHHPPIYAPSLNHGILPLNTHNSSEFADSSDLGGSTTPGSGPSGEPARTIKRPRLVWTPQLHKRFVDAVAHLGIKNAVPKTIMQLMSVDGLTRENVASHLQKYRLYLKRMQWSSSPGGNGALGVNGGSPMVDPATDHLFASGPVPPHFLPFVPVTAMHQHAQIGGTAASIHPQMQMQMHMHNYRQVGGGHIGSGVAANRQYENHHHFLGREAQPAPHHRIGGGGGVRVGGIQPFVEDLESADGNNGYNRKILTLFPTGDD